MAVKASITVNIGVRKGKKGTSNNQKLRKYDWWNILPKFLFEQLRQISNLYFLGVILIEQVPDVANRGRYGTLSALLLMLTLFFLKEVAEDLKRRYSDDQVTIHHATFLIYFDHVFIVDAEDAHLVFLFLCVI